MKKAAQRWRPRQWIAAASKEQPGGLAAVWQHAADAALTQSGQKSAQRRSGKKGAITLAFLASFALPIQAFAQGSGGTSPTGIEAPKDDEQKPTPVPFREDKVSGHFQLGVGGTLVQPYGRVSEGIGNRFRGGPGGGPLVDLSFGIDRFVSLGAYGEVQWLSESRICAECSGTTFGAGLFVRYHIVQGLRLDPWISYGAGYRGLEAESQGEELSYAGVEWLRLQFGANWYALPNLNLGPFFALGAATMVTRPQGEELGGPDVRLQLGLRIALDFPGR